jgi:hypothetical protein
MIEIQTFKPLKKSLFEHYADAEPHNFDKMLTVYANYSRGVALLRDVDLLVAVLNTWDSGVFKESRGQELVDALTHELREVELYGTRLTDGWTQTIKGRTHIFKPFTNHKAFLELSWISRGLKGYVDRVEEYRESYLRLKDSPRFLKKLTKTEKALDELARFVFQMELDRTSAKNGTPKGTITATLTTE